MENPSAPKSPVPCVSCSYALFEMAVEVKVGSRVWLRVKCKGCKTWNIVTYRDGKIAVAQQ